MPEDVTFRDKSELLTFEEMARIITVAATLGVNKIRLTGGEPLMRRNLATLARMVVAVPGITDVGLTTNGVLLAEQAQDLYAAGLRRLNVSLDTLDAGRFRELARREGLDRVLAGLEVAKSLGFQIKLNAVALRGFIELDAGPLAHYCRENGFELRFIESMPIGAQPWDRSQAVLAHELLEILEREVAPLAPATDYDPHAPAMEFAYADGRGRVGIIASVSRPFCKSCNRLRLTADGKLRNCLFSLDETDVKAFVRRPVPDDAGIAAALRASVWSKWEGHEINTAKFIKPGRTMHAIGG